MNRATGIRELLETVNENVIAMAIRIRRNALTRFKSYVIDRVLDKSQRKWDSFGTGVVARLVIEIEKTGIAAPETINPSVGKRSSCNCTIREDLVAREEERQRTA